MKRLLQRSTIKPLEKRGTEKLLHSALLDSNLRKHLQWESSSTLIPRCHFQQKTVQWCCQVLLRHLRCIQTFCGHRALSLPPTLQSAFTTHSSFLVEDLLRISRPATFMHRSIPSPSASPPATGATTLNNYSTVHVAMSTSLAKRSSSPQTSVSNDPNYLKFGVNAILASTTRNGRFIFCL